METKSSKELILEILKRKACLKQKVYRTTIEVFNDFKDQARVLIEEIKTDMKQVDKHVIVEFVSKGNSEFHIKFGGDILVFYMHTNVFSFDKSHSIWNTAYIKDDDLRAYCGVINIYNFLADSFKYNRFNDSGYLVARFFVNKELHYFVEGKRQLGFLYNNFATSVISKKEIKKIIESSILYSLDFDLLTPPYTHVQEIKLDQIIEVTNQIKLKTGKRLGFQFKVNKDNIK